MYTTLSKNRKGIPLNTTLAYGIFYAVTTIGLIIYFIKEKKIEKNRKEKSMKRIDTWLTKYSLFMGNERNFIVKFIDGTISLGLVILLVLFIQKFYIGNFTVPTASMEPTVMIGERFFGNMVTPKFVHPKRDTIVIFREPVNDKLRYTKRLIGLPGESIAIGDNGHLVINGVSEPNSRIYSRGNEDSLLGAGTWTIPKKGDKISLKNGVFQVVYKTLSFDDLKTYLINNGGIPEKGVRVNSGDFEFTVNNVVYKQGLFSYITNMEETLELLRGNSLVKDGRTIKIIKGNFELIKDGVTGKELLKDYEADKKIKFLYSSGTFVLNGNVPTGPISDRDILLELIKNGEYTLNNDYFFMLGDNTNNSLDSRYWGFVKDERILGTLLIRYWPLNKMKVMIDQ